ncbi:hypothetical protein GCM10025794_35600 [Massilia kyonggiensis]
MTVEYLKFFVANHRVCKDELVHIIKSGTKAYNADTKALGRLI